jgi:hypothetical protein
MQYLPLDDEFDPGSMSNDIGRQIPVSIRLDNHENDIETTIYEVVLNLVHR